MTNDDPKFMALLQGNDSAVPEVVYTEGVVSVILERTPPAGRAYGHGLARQQRRPSGQ